MKIDPEQLYRRLAQGSYVEEIFPFYSNNDFNLMRHAIQKYLDIIPKGIIPTLVGFITGVPKMMELQVIEISRVTQLDVEDVRQSIAAVSIIAMGNTTPSQIHSRLNEGALKGIDQIIKQGATPNKKFAQAIGFVVLYAAMLWNYKHNR